MRVAVVVADGFEQEELEAPVRALRDAGIAVDVLAPDVEHRDHVHGLGRSAGAGSRPDRLLRDADPNAYDGLFIPGGGPSLERMRGSRLHFDFVKRLVERRKPIAAIGDGPKLLADEGLVRGRTMTSEPAVREALERAGAHWVDREVVVDGNVVTGRSPEDIPAFSTAFLRLLEIEYERLARPYAGEMESIDDGAVQLEGGRTTAPTLP